MTEINIGGKKRCCNPYSALKEEIDMTMDIAMNARNMADEALRLASGTPSEAYDSDPEPLGTASPGTVNQYARGDHVHPTDGLVTDDDLQTVQDDIDGVRSDLDDILDGTTEVPKATLADTATYAGTAVSVSRLGNITVGDDTKPIYLDDGSPVAVANELMTADTAQICDIGANRKLFRTATVDADNSPISISDSAYNGTEFPDPGDPDWYTFYSINDTMTGFGRAYSSDNTISSRIRCSAGINLDGKKREITLDVGYDKTNEKSFIRAFGYENDVAFSQIVPRASSNNVGDDTHPIKIVNGVAAPVTNELQTKLTPTVIKSQFGITVQRYGQLIVVTAEGYNHGIPEVHTVFSDMPRAIRFGNGIMMRNRQVAGEIYINTNTRNLVVDEYISGGAYGCLSYLTDE